MKKRNQKIILGISLLLLTIISFTTAILSENDIIQTVESLDLPIHNSVLLVSNKSINPCIPSDTGDSCVLTQEGIVIQESSASGMAIKSINGLTYILTANHFCLDSQSFQIEGLGINLDASMWAVDIEGSMWETRIVFQELETDLCLISSNMGTVDTILLSDSDPQVGDKVYAIASPRGIGGKNISLHFEGKFSGCDITGNCFFTIPSTFGSSGGIILNATNEIVGMIQMKPANFDSISIGTRRENIVRFLDNFNQETGINLLNY